MFGYQSAVSYPVWFYEEEEIASHCILMVVTLFCLTCTELMSLLQLGVLIEESVWFLLFLYCTAVELLKYATVIAGQCVGLCIVL